MVRSGRLVALGKIVNENLPPYVLKRSTQSRRIRLWVLPGGRVVVSAPNRVSEKVINSFIGSHISWLHDKIEYFKKFPESKISLAQEKKFFKEHKQKAQALAENKIKQWNEHYQFSLNKIAIRNSRSRWGSCSGKGTISFNYKIVFLPEELLDYLTVHELCHLQESNHSKAFWLLVASKIPDYITCRSKLRQFKIPC